MFTGIVSEKARIVSVTERRDLVTLRAAFSPGYLADIKVGASVALHGCCLTVTEIFGDEVTFDLVPETIARTSFKGIKAGDTVNAERSLKFGDEVGGHLLSGHIDTIATIADIQTLELSKIMTFRVPEPWIKYIFEKGYVALNGASLTVTNVNKGESSFKVSLIPETLSKTTFGDAVVGQIVNIEIDRSTQVIVNTVERIMAERR